LASRRRLARPWPRRGVSELYATMLMVGVTLSLGGVVSFAAAGQFELNARSASLGAALVQSSAGVQLSLVYVSTPASASCPTYQGYNEGAILTLSLYNYGTTSFTPAEFVVNSTAYPGVYGTLAPGSMVGYTVSSGSCIHSSGQAILVIDTWGDAIQLES